MIRTIGILLGLLTAALVGAQELPPPRPVPMPMPTPLPGPGLAPRPIDGEECMRLPNHQLKELLQQLEEERQLLSEAFQSAARTRDEAVSSDQTNEALLKLRVKELLHKLGQGRHAPTPHSAPKAPAKKGQPTDPSAPPPFPLLEKPPPTSVPALPNQPLTVDPLSLAHALFRVGNYEAALRTYRMVELKGARADQRTPVQYLMACCLRRLGKTDEAAKLYREVANSKGDEELAACAQWQLAAMRWRKDALEQIEAVRQRRLALGKMP
jgi:tetratricopeptide (TPR) repeat protein